MRSAVGLEAHPADERPCCLLRRSAASASLPSSETRRSSSSSAGDPGSSRRGAACLVSTARSSVSGSFGTQNPCNELSPLTVRTRHNAGAVLCSCGVSQGPHLQSNGVPLPDGDGDGPAQALHELRHDPHRLVSRPRLLRCGRRLLPLLRERICSTHRRPSWRADSAQQRDRWHMSVPSSRAVGTAKS